MLGHLTPVCAQDYEALAQAKLSDQVWAYSAGGAADEITVRENRSAWDTLRPLPRVMQPLGGGNTAITLLGRTWPMPLLLGPVALQKLAHAQGEEATAMAAAAQGTGWCSVPCPACCWRWSPPRCLTNPHAGRCGFISTCNPTVAPRRHWRCTPADQGLAADAAG